VTVAAWRAGAVLAFVLVLITAVNAVVQLLVGDWRESLMIERAHIHSFPELQRSYLNGKLVAEYRVNEQGVRSLKLMDKAS